ncbi:MAG TPA: GNAT family N-acetyltransferase [Steroidobacteraceae bacterium]|nr:GNAT family N-acetyltransferase [Steroidobacteraceae bacterium]
MSAAVYSATETLRDGRPIEIRALARSDQDEVMAAVGRSSAASLYRRFFAVRREFSDQEVEFFLSADFNSHVALVAVMQREGHDVIVGGGRYIVVRPGMAELAFMVEDGCQGLGIGGVLMRHLVVLARRAGLKQLIAEVLPENQPMLKVLEKSGLPLTRKQADGVLQVVLSLA